MSVLLLFAIIFLITFLFCWFGGCKLTKPLEGYADQIAHASVGAIAGPVSPELAYYIEASNLPFGTGLKSNAQYADWSQQVQNANYEGYRNMGLPFTNQGKRTGADESSRCQFGCERHGTPQCVCTEACPIKKAMAQYDKHPEGCPFGCPLAECKYGCEHNDCPYSCQGGGSNTGNYGGYQQGNYGTK